jgi:hypothetical protein
MRPSSDLVRSICCMMVFLSCIDSSKLTGYECDTSGRCASGVNNAAGGGGAGGGASACTPICGETQRCIESRCVEVASLKENGLTCGSAAECRTGLCADGYCCNTACDGSCDSCAELNARGVCTISRGGEAGAPSCSPFLCSGASSACAATCASAADCAAGFVCGASNQCVQKQDLGSACALGNDCKSGFCSDAVCCESSCAGNCDSCNLQGSVGQCKPATVGTVGSPLCPGALVCNGTAVDCPIVCGVGKPNCPTGYFCNPANQLCSAQRDNGTTCGSSGECKSGQCADGVCCNAACAGACDACSVAQGAPADGTCSLVGARRVCRAAAGPCDVAEACAATSADCPTESFVAQGTTCAPSQGDCDLAEVCTGASAACPPNTRKPLGTSCRSASGVCDAAEVCNGNSDTCPTDGFLGNTTVCGPAQTCFVRANCRGDARDCPANTVAPTGSACPGGVCNGAGTCNPCAQDAQCGSQSACVGLFTNCITGMAECGLVRNLANGTACTLGGLSGSCNGAGTCVTCTPGGLCDTGNECTQGEYICQGGSRVCQATAKVNGTTCSVGTCNSGLCSCVPGGSCDTGNECQSGTFICQGVSRICQSAPKSAGTACTAGVCNGAGTCVACTAGLACAPTNICQTGVTSCATGAQTCVVNGNKPSGTDCGMKYEKCNGTGLCVCIGCPDANGCGPSCGSGQTCCGFNGCRTGACP